MLSEKLSYTYPDPPEGEPEKYFTCHTLSGFLQAKSKQFENNTSIEFQFDDGTWKSLSYGQLDWLTSRLAYTIYKTLREQYQVVLTKDITVGIMHSHCADYFFLLYALLKLKCKAMLISPRNSVEAAESLIRMTQTKVVFAGPLYADLISSVPVYPFPNLNYSVLLEPTTQEQELVMMEQFKMHTSDELNDTAVIVHSSGTTAFPKPVHLNNKYMLFICQTVINNHQSRNHMAVCPTERSKNMCIFPIFHAGGVVNVLRFFIVGGCHSYLNHYPASSKAIVEYIKQEKEVSVTAPLWILEKLAVYMKETNDIEPFQKNVIFFETGGCVIPPYIFEHYKKHNLRLGAIYGMSECPFLMTTNFDLDEHDNDVLFLTASQRKYCLMEPFDDQRVQLIIKKNCPYLATGVSNRENGDYDTKDLFYKSKYPDGFYYSGRADDTLIMANGEKTNPVPMESAIRESPFVSQCIVFGHNKTCTGLLVEVDQEFAKGYNEQAILDSVRTFVAVANKSAPSHSMILPEMIAILPADRHLPVTDKGSVSRSKADTQFKDIIDALYTHLFDSKVTPMNTIDFSKEVLETTILSWVADLLNTRMESIDMKRSLFDQGLTSLTAIQLRNKMVQGVTFVPQEFIYEHTSISAMIDAIVSNKVEITDTFITTKTILNSFIERANKDIPKQKNKHFVLLTGATGSLGAFLLRDLLQNTDQVKKVYALVRQDRHTTAQDRVIKSFGARRLDTSLLLDSSRFEALEVNDKAPTYLGLASKQVYDQLTAEVTMIQACGWMLDFYKTVQTYEKECIEGFYHLVKFAHQNRVSPIPLHFISSVSASFSYGEVVPEIPMPMDPRQATSLLGYGQSKYIVEKLLDYLWEEKKMPCYIHRVGQVCGDSIHGVWNTSEFMSMLLVGGSGHLGLMPDLHKQIDWIPVDYASKTIHDIMLKTSEFRSEEHGHIFHIINPHSIGWNTLLENLKEIGLSFDIVPFEDWIKKLKQQGSSNPAYKFVDFIEKNFMGTEVQNVTFETTQTATIVPVLLDTPKVDTVLLDKFFQHWKEMGSF